MERRRELKRTAASTVAMTVAWGRARATADTGDFTVTAISAAGVSCGSTSETPADDAEAATAIPPRAPGTSTNAVMARSAMRTRGVIRPP